MPTTQTLSSIGFQGAVGIGIETTAGTLATPTVWLPAVDISLQADNKFIKRMPVRQSKGQVQVGDGQVAVSGGLLLEANPMSLGIMLGLAMGKDTTGALTGGTYPHVFKLASPLNTCSITVDAGKGTLHQYLGCKVETLDLSCKPGSVVDAKLAFLGVTDVPAAGTASPTYGSVDQPYQFEMLSTASACTINGVNVNPESFQIQLKNNLKPYYAGGSGRFIYSMNETQADVTGTIAIQYTNENLFNILYGTAGTGPSKSPLAGGIATVPVSFTFTHPTTGYNLILSLPAVKFDTAPITIKKNDIIVHQIKFSAFESSVGAADDLTVTLNHVTQSTTFVS